MVNSRKTIRMQVKMKKTPKKYHLLNATKQIYKIKKILMKRKRTHYTMNGVILKPSITHYRKIRLIIQKMKMKSRIRNMNPKMIPKVYRVL